MEINIQGKNELFCMETKPFFIGGQGSIYFATGKVSNLGVVVKEYKDPKSKITFYNFFQKIDRLFSFLWTMIKFFWILPLLALL